MPLRRLAALIPITLALTAAAPSAALAQNSWCGGERATDEVTHELDNGDYRYHAVYLVAADAPNRFPAVADRIQADAFAASGLIERTRGRAIRFDMGTSCGKANLDISVVRSRLTTDQYARAAARPNGTLNAVAAELDAAGFPTLQSGDGTRRAKRLKRNWVVWLDTPAPAGACGEAQVYDDPTRSQSNLNNFGGKAALVFRARDGFCGAAAVRHEVTHTLGGLVSGATNNFDGTHCNDAFEDTMCYPDAPRRSGSSFQDEYYDYGSDDYWDPPRGKPLRWWTVNLSRFVCPDAACNRVASAGVKRRSSAPRPPHRRRAAR